MVLGALVRGGQVLLAHRSPRKQVHPNLWDLPGGMVEPGESDRHAIERELFEELGVRIELASVSLLTRCVVGTDLGTVQISVWVVRAWSGTPFNRAPEEHVAVEWWDLADVKLPHPGVAALIRSTQEPGDASTISD